MKIIFISLIVLFLCLQGISSQIDSSSYSFYTKYKKKESFYNKKAKALIRRDLIKENIYNVFSAHEMLKGTNLIKIPMYKIKWNDTTNYINQQNLLNSIRICNKFMFSDIFILKRNKVIGYYSCDDYGTGGVSLIKEPSTAFNRYYQNVTNVISEGYEHIFYIQ
ncbi:MAG: hypothetical protein GXO47_06210, partial [Chlorobi bacterium]|nr:hypothetical protein [Chlorobiota bacterium]